MRNSKQFALTVDAVRASSVPPIAILMLSCALTVMFVLLSMSKASEYGLLFTTTSAVFAIAAIAYLSIHGVKGTAWISVPVIVTFEALLGFLIVPAFGFAMGYDAIDEEYAKAAFVSFVGLIAFWAASLLLKRNCGIRFSPEIKYTTRRIHIFAATMLTVGVIGNLILWKTGLFAYASDPGLRAAYSGVIAWLNLSSNLLVYTLVIAAIEVFGKQSSQKFMRAVLWITLGVSVIFGIISGMKSAPITPFFYLMLIYTTIRRRVPRSVVLVPVVLIGLIYPFVTAFRTNLNSGYRAQFNTLQGLEDTVSRSFDDAFRSFGSNTSETRSRSLQETAGRLSYLSYVRDVVTLPYPELLNGDEKLWLAPIYPFIPRFLWPSKPIMNKGQRLSMLLGRGSESSSAVTPIGDLYAQYGIYGVAVGMFLWGVCLQLFVEAMSAQAMTERKLFVYVVMLPQLIGLEVDFTALIAGCVQALMVALIISFMLYGRPVSPVRGRRSHWDAGWQS